MPSQETRQRSTVAFVEELPRLLKEKGMSISAVARAAGTQQSHLSRVLRQMDYKRPSADLAKRVARALGLPDDYFPEYREGRVVDRLRADPDFRDELYERLAGKESDGSS